MNINELKTLSIMDGYASISYHIRLNAFVLDNQITRVLEIGAGWGSTAYAMQGTRDCESLNDKVQVTTIDDLSGVTDRGLLASSAMKAVKLLPHKMQDIILRNLTERNEKFQLIHFNLKHDGFNSINSCLYAVLNAIQGTDDTYRIIIRHFADEQIQNAVHAFCRNYPAMCQLTPFEAIVGSPMLLTLKCPQVQPEKRSMRVLVPAGIGDIAWVMQKLATANVTVDLQISAAGPKRGQDFAELYKFVKSVEYATIGYQDLHKTRFPDDGNFEKDFDAKKVYRLTANSHLELGNHITDFLPAYPTDYLLRSLDLRKPADPNHKERWEVDKPVIHVALSPSSYKSNACWVCGDAEQWVKYMIEIQSKHDTCCVHFGLVGATYDMSLCGDIMKLARKQKINCINYSGKMHIAETFRYVLACKYLIAFPSGIGIVGSLLGTRTVMFMPAHLKPMCYKWLPPVQFNLKHVMIEDIATTDVIRVLTEDL